MREAVHQKRLEHPVLYKSGSVDREELHIKYGILSLVLSCDSLDALNSRRAPPICQSVSPIPRMVECQCMQRVR